MKLGWPTDPLPFPIAPEAADVASIVRLIPRASGDSRSLDLGCGAERQQFAEPLARLGYRNTSIDIEGEAADALADAHLLPFGSGSFRLVVTNAVFEHLKNPHVAVAEVARVLAPGGCFAGSIAFSEPYHVSYFHHSPLAVFELLESSGFETQVIILDREWHAFRAHLQMGYAGARLPPILRRLLASGFYRLSLLPPAIKAALLLRPEHLRESEMGFAKSHSALVGFRAVRRHTTDASRVVRVSPP